MSAPVDSEWPSQRTSKPVVKESLSVQKRLKVVLQYNSLPHYREALFKRMAKDPDIDYLIIADRKSETPHMDVIEAPEKKFRFAPARLFQIPIGRYIIIFWQPAAIRRSFAENPDAIITLANPYSLTAWALLIGGWFKNIPVLLWGHGLLGPESGPKWWLRKMFYRLATGHLLYGNYAKNLLIEKGFESERLHVVYNSLDYDAQRIISDSISAADVSLFRTQLGVPSDGGLVVFTGRLQKVKRLDILLRAVSILKERGILAHIALIGKGDEQEPLERLAGSLEIEQQIHFLGESYDERFIGTVFKASGACVIPSGAGLTVMHALAYGTPVIIHDRFSEHFPEWEAVEDGKTGFF